MEGEFCLADTKCQSGAKISFKLLEQRGRNCLKGVVVSPIYIVEHHIT